MTMPYDEDEDAERQLLIRAEADAARQEANRLGRGDVPATPVAEYGHMPVQCRGPMAKMNDWFLNKEIHDRFALYMRCNRNRRMEAIEAAVARETLIGFPAYISEVGKAKNIEQWKSRALAVHIPSECVLACRSINDVGRLLAMTFMATSENPIVAADLKTMDYFVDEEAKRYLAS